MEILYGILVGAANIIPGVSGGTILLLIGIYEKTINSLNNLLKKENKLTAIIYLIKLFFGAVIGIVVFAKLLNYFFNRLETETYFFFIGLVISSLISVSKKEKSINKYFALLGVIIVLTLNYFKIDNDINLLYEFSITTVFILILVGIISGGTMILPGISGSLILLILGQYHKVKNLFINILNINNLILLGFMGIGVLIGVFIVSKLMKFLLEKHKKYTMSLIIGLIFGSIYVLIPKIDYNFGIMATAIASLVLGFLSVEILKYKNNKI